MTTTSDLFSPIQLGPFELPHRVAMAPLTRTRTGPTRTPGEMNARYYAQRASAALIIAEATSISPEANAYPETPGICTDELVAGWKLVTDAVHEAGGRIFLQLWHVGRISLPCYQPDGRAPGAPSPIKPEGEHFTFEGRVPIVTPRELTEAEIAEIVNDFGEATRRAREAGFDGVELHGANTYLIEQFLHPGTNQRTDGYGGSVEARARFLFEVVQAACDAWSPEHVGLRVSPQSRYFGGSQELREETYAHVADGLSGKGLAYLHVLENTHQLEEDVALLPMIRARFDGVLIANSEYDKEIGERAVRQGLADMIAYGKLFISNPDLPLRFEADAPLAEWDRATFYGTTEVGYTDYPMMSE